MQAIRVMHELLRLTGIAALTWLGACACVDAAEPHYPTTQRDNVKDVLHGVELADPYRWLEDQQSPQTRAWIDAQNAHTASVLDKLPGRRELAKRLTALLEVDTISTPVVRGDRYFFTRRAAGQDLPAIYFRQGPDGEDQVLVDPHELSPDHTTSVVLLDIAEDGTLLAYGIRRGGEDELAVRFLDIETRRDLTDKLPTARYFSIALKADNGGLFYARHDDDGPRIYEHTFGQPVAEDRLVFGEGYGPEKIIDVEMSDDGRYLLLTVYYGSAAKKTELYLVEVAQPDEIVTVVNKIEARFTGHVAGEHVFLETNWQAPQGRVLATKVTEPTAEHWVEIVPESEASLVAVAPIGGKLVATYLNEVKSQVKRFDIRGKPLGELVLPEIGSVGQLSGNWDGDAAFVGFSSFNLPSTIYRYDVASGQRDVWASDNVPFDSDRYEVRQVWYSSRDGTRVPMFLVHAKDLVLDGQRPTLLSGYGGFNISLTPRFSALVAAWLEYGGVFAVPNLRGGGEFGEPWHEAGMLERKQNVFDDFIAAAEWLIDQKYTNPAKLAISGASNGGLLVGAALTQRPELFQAAICRYPLLDMVRYHQFLVARFWVPEYGSSEDAEQFAYLHAYSPYHRVEQHQHYPAVLFITGDADTRVDPLHARKMAALLQSATASDRPVLLRYDTKAGHARGSTPVSKQVAEMTDELSFLFWQLGVDGDAKVTGD